MAILSLPLLALAAVAAVPSVLGKQGEKVKFFPRYHDEHADSHTTPFNAHNPHREILKRSITTNTAEVSGMSFDFIIAGGGCAGLALASRLSEWNNVTVLVVEAGTDGAEFQDRIDIPGNSYLNGLGSTTFDWGYSTVPQKDADNNTRRWPRGKGLGGSGSTNGLFWGRGGDVDYDAWATLNPGAEQTWDWAEMSKYINKTALSLSAYAKSTHTQAETFNPPNASQQQKFGMVFDGSAHGSTGPIQTGLCEYIFDAVANWIPAWITLGIPAKDLWAGSTRGVMITPSTINPINQTRSDSKAGYIDPLPPRSNLVILTGQQVTSVIFNGSTVDGNVVASGVTFQSGSGSTSYSVQANKEVILAGGTVGSPQILQLSGVGPATRLTNLGINSVIDLPVGYNLQDHVSTSMYWSAPTNVTTWAELQNDADLRASELEKYHATATGMWTYVNEAVGYIAMEDLMDAASLQTYISTVGADLDTTLSDVTSWQSLPDNVSAGLKAQYDIMHQRLSTDLGQLEIIMTMLGNNGNRHELGIQVALQHPWSRGSIFITNNDPFTQPAIDPDYFGVGYDIDIMSYGAAFARRLARAEPLNSVMTTESVPGAGTTGDALNTFTKTTAGTEYHPLGTCSMLPRNMGGVVDTNLLVYGTSNLRVIDASIMPLQVSAHLMASTYGIAEKGADLIKAKYFAVQETTTSATASDAAGANTSGTTAVIGQATDAAVTEQNNKATTGSLLSTGAKIGIGLGAGLGAAALLAALLVFFCLRRKRQAPGPKGGWYQSTPTADPSGGYKEDQGAYGSGGADVGAYPMAPFAATGYTRSNSVDTMATADLASKTPMRSESGYGSYMGQEVPYRDGSPAPEAGGYGQATLGGAEYPRQQTYKPVNLS